MTDISSNTNKITATEKHDMTDITSIFKKPHSIFYIGQRENTQRNLTPFIEKIKKIWNVISDPEIFVPSLVVIVALSIGVYLIGNNTFLPENTTSGQILATSYHPPYTTTSTWCSSKGGCSTQSYAHPAAYKAKIQIPQSEKTVEVELSRSEYEFLKTKEKEYYQATFQIGRFNHKALEIKLKKPLQKSSTNDIQLSQKSINSFEK